MVTLVRKSSKRHIFCGTRKILSMNKNNHQLHKGLNNPKKNPKKLKKKLVNKESENPAVPYNKDKIAISKALCEVKTRKSKTKIILNIPDVLQNLLKYIKHPEKIIVEKDKQKSGNKQSKIKAKLHKQETKITVPTVEMSELKVNQEIFDYIEKYRDEQIAEGTKNNLDQEIPLKSDTLIPEIVFHDMSSNMGFIVDKVEDEEIPVSTLSENDQTKIMHEFAIAMKKYSNISQELRKLLPSKERGGLTSEEQNYCIVYGERYFHTFLPKTPGQDIRHDGSVYRLFPPNG